MKKVTPAQARFVELATTHMAEVTWWWTSDKLHDIDYHIRVSDSVNAKVRELERKYDVRDDTRYCCQWEGHLLEGSILENVEAAASELAAHLTRFKGIRPLCL